MSSERPLSRRRLLLGATAAGGAAVAAMATPVSASSPTLGHTRKATESTAAATEPCHGPHQAGVTTPTQAHATLVGLNLVDTAPVNLARLLRLWTDDIVRLTSGRPTLTDPVVELSDVPARLTITVGLGPGAFVDPSLADQRPQWLQALPGFPGDALEDQFSGGDVMLQVAADDPVTVTHAVSALTTAARGLANPAWTQRGFHRAAGMTEPSTVGRNLMGFVDGIVNPAPGTADFDAVVWHSGQPEWLRGGTGMVLRRIRIDVNGWASLSRRERELSVGRFAESGAPLTGGEQTDAADLSAIDDNGLSVIPPFAHISVAAPTSDQERIFRRSFNFDDGFAGGLADQGNLFIAFAADPEKQFIPIQQRLSEQDLMHTWLTATGSAVFAILPGFAEGEWLGQTLLGPL